MKAEKLFLELENYEGLAKVYNNLGNTYSKLYDLPTAIKFYNKSLTLKEKSPNKIDISPNLINIGTIYYNLGNFKKCIELNERALILCLQSNDFESIAIIYSNLGAAQERIGEYKKSINFLLKALEIYHHEHIDHKAEIRAYTNLGSTYLSLSKLSDARFYYNQGLSLNNDFGSISHQTVLLNNLAELERQAHNIPLALTYVKQAISLAKSNNDLEEESLGYNELYLIEKDAGDYKSALNSYIKYIDLSDSLSEMYNVNQTKTSLLQNEIEVRKDQEKESVIELKLLQEKDNVLTLLLWPLGISIIMWIISYYRFKSQNWFIRSLNYLIPTLINLVIVIFIYQRTLILVNSGSPFFIAVILGTTILTVVIYLLLSSFTSHLKS